MIRVEVPQAALAVYSEEAVRKMLASVAFRTVPTEELLGMLPFKLGDLAGFRVMRVVPDGILVIDGQGDDMSAKSYALVRRPSTTSSPGCSIRSSSTAARRGLPSPAIC